MANLKQEYLPYIWTPDDYFEQASIESIFGGDTDGADIEVDIGCGEGSFLVEMARRYPERYFLGIERYLGRVCKVAKKAGQAELSNLRLLRLESVYSVAWLLPSQSMSRVHLICPDPWNKKKQQKKRVICDQAFKRGIERMLIGGGEFLLKTDQREYCETARAEFSQIESMREQPWNETEESYAFSDFEKQWLAMGRSMHTAKWVKIYSILK